LSEALAEFCSRATEKLRRQHSVTGCITVFIRTSPFNPHEPQYQRAASIKLDAATQDTLAIIATANRMLKDIFKAGFNYHKCGVQLSHIQPESSPGQIELFDFPDDNLPTENRPLMKIVDQINRRFPKGILVAATGFDKTWKPEADRISQR
jgi:DNA polymerase V